MTRLFAAAEDRGRRSLKANHIHKARPASTNASRKGRRKIPHMQHPQPAPRVSLESFLFTQNSIDDCADLSPIHRDRRAGNCH